MGNAKDVLRPSPVPNDCQVGNRGENGDWLGMRTIHVGVKLDLMKPARAGSETVRKPRSSASALARAPIVQYPFLGALNLHVHARRGDQDHGN